MENVHRFQEFEFSLSEGLLPPPQYRLQGRVRNGFQIQMLLGRLQGLPSDLDSKADKEKMAFYTDKGTYCYTKMPFGLKMQEPFEEGKFLGYMVTSEGIRANPKKTKVLADLQSPRTLKEMQSLARKLAALNRFLAKSAERSLPFINTLKNITKENKHEYKWTIEGEEAFQQMNKCIINLLSLTPPLPKETLYAYLAVSKEAVSFVLLTDRKGKQCLIHYVSRTLNDTENNYTPMEKLALSLVHMTRRLRRLTISPNVEDFFDLPNVDVLDGGYLDLTLSSPMLKI
ncbi:reverse transcriptase domain-containing protein [Tanacetum coccineum]